MGEDALKQPVGKKLLRLFCLVGLAVSGLWVLAELATMTAAMASGSNAADAASEGILAVTGRLLILVFFFWGFRKAGARR